MQKAKHEDFHISGYVSFWLGNFTSEEELDDYLSEEFENDFGFEIYPPTGPEYDVSTDGSKPISELIEGFSRWQLFIDAAITTASARNWDMATTAVVFYGFKYAPKFINPNGSGKLTFIGNVLLNRISK
jgi:hypothetical protein